LEEKLQFMASLGNDLRLREILRTDRRYAVEAYSLVSAALRRLQRRRGRRAHVSGRDLVRGVVELALERYGNLARLVLEKWGIYRSEDIGEVVFNLVKAGILSTSPEDSKEDFRGHPAFTVVFDKAPIEW